MDETVIKAIMATYTSVTSVIYDEEGNYSAIDADNNPVAIDMTVVNAAKGDYTAEVELADLRYERNQRLQATDWTQGSDVPDSIKTPWATYRQSLRDITATYQSMNDDGFAWPVEPE